MKLLAEALVDGFGDRHAGLSVTVRRSSCRCGGDVPRTDMLGLCTSGQPEQGTERSAPNSVGRRSDRLRVGVLRKAVHVVANFGLQKPEQHHTDRCREE